MSERPQDAGSGRIKQPPQFEGSYFPDRSAMLAALRVVLGLPKRLREYTTDDLLSSDTQSEAVFLTVENTHSQEETA